MNTLRKVGLAAVTAVLTVGALGISAPANALDTSWGCPGCHAGGAHS